MLIQIKLTEPEPIAITNLNKFNHFKTNFKTYFDKFNDLWFKLIHDFGQTRIVLLHLLRHIEG
jgi:hypothetical protein